jgi:multidrug efflux pump subunit AcrA (membrane-fusion protein)
MTWRLLIPGAAAVLCLLAGCAREDQSAAKQQPKAGLLVSAASVVRRTMDSTLTIPGTIVAANQVTVRAPSSGLLSNLTLLPGEKVKRGQMVATVTTREEIAARAGAQLARRLDPADSAAMARAVSRYGTSPGIAVTVVENGTVAKRDASNGQFVNEFDPIVELIDSNSIYVEAQLPVRFLTRIRPGQRATISSQALSNPLDGHIAAILPNAAPASQTFPIRIAFDQGNAFLQAGIAVDVSLTTASQPDVLVVPASAVFINPETQKHYVFTIGPDGKSHRQAVEVGIRDASDVEVLSGLAERTRVITSGGYALSDGLRVRVAASGDRESQN